MAALGRAALHRGSADCQFEKFHCAGTVGDGRDIGGAVDRAEKVAEQRVVALVILVRRDGEVGLPDERVDAVGKRRIRDRRP